MFGHRKHLRCTALKLAVDAHVHDGQHGYIDGGAIARTAETFHRFLLGPLDWSTSFYPHGDPDFGPDAAIARELGAS